jgi:hypothetical protein
MLAPPASDPKAKSRPDDYIVDHDVNSDKFTLHPDDPKNFLKLCSALCILTQRRLLDSDINQAEQLLREYCSELIPVSFTSLCCQCCANALYHIALRVWGYPTQPPLCDTCDRVCPQLWPTP